MTTTKTKALTPKQKEVYELRDRTPEKIADALGITTSGVYGHIRRIREAGHRFEIQHSSNGGSPQRKIDDALPSMPVDALDDTTLGRAGNVIEGQAKREAELSKELRDRAVLLENELKATETQIANSEARQERLDAARRALSGG